MARITDFLPHGVTIAPDCFNFDPPALAAAYAPDPTRILVLAYPGWYRQFNVFGAPLAAQRIADAVWEAREEGSE